MFSCSSNEDIVGCVMRECVYVWEGLKKIQGELRSERKEGKKEVTLGGRQDKGKALVCYRVPTPFAQ